MNFIILLMATVSTSAFAQAAAPKAPGLLEVLMMPAGIILIMYFFMIRPQQKKAKEHATILAGLKKGDEVVTSGGLIGKIRTVAEGFVTVEVANGLSIKVVKHHVTGLTKTPDAAVAQATPKKAKPAKA